MAGLLALPLVGACPVPMDGPPGATDQDNPSTGEESTESGSSPGETTADPTTTTSPTTSGSETSTETEAGTTASSTTEHDSCGDGVLDAGEECDLGRNNADFGPCTTSCLHATCGDGFTWAGTEECDLGEFNGADGSVCSAECTVNAHCGDYDRDPLTEECDDKTLFELGACTETCELAGRIVFATSATFDGDLQSHGPPNGTGIEGADTICQSLAAAAHLHHPERFLAWISATPETSPSQRFPDVILQAEPVVLTIDGTVVAPNWNAFTSGSLEHPINRTELGEEIGNEKVWTNTTPAGDVDDPARSCDGWSSPAFEEKGRRGLAIASDHAWTQFGTANCNVALHHLYCVEMPEVAE